MPHLIVFSHLRWSFVYQRPQHLLTRLASHYRVCYVEEPIYEAGEAYLEARTEPSGVTVVTPHTPVEAGGFHDDQLPVLARLLNDLLCTQKIDDYVVWFYTPMALPLLADLRPRAVVYDCMDDLASFKDAPRQLRQRETALMKRADLILAGGPALYEAKAGLHSNVHCLPSAVDALHFSRARVAADFGEDQAAVAALHRDMPHPRLGFYGVIDERLDVALLEKLADAHPEWQLVMVGPVVKIDPAALPQRPNIHWLGMQGYARLPHLAASWDVCLLPFALNESTRFISPTKTLEYVAAEKPVVSTAVRDVSVLYGDVVRVAQDHDDFVRACEAALGDSALGRDESVCRMAETVARYSWDATAEKIYHLIADVRPPQPAQAQPIANGTASVDDRPEPSVVLRPAAESSTPRFGT